MQIKLELIAARSRSTTSFSASWGPVSNRKISSRSALHLAQVTRAGISLLEGLKDLVDQVENPRFRSIIGAVVEAIQSGTQFADSLAAYPKTFDHTFVALVRAGEQSGNIPETFQSWQNH